MVDDAARWQSGCAASGLTCRCTRRGTYARREETCTVILVGRDTFLVFVFLSSPCVTHTIEFTLQRNDNLRGATCAVSPCLTVIFLS